MGELSQKVKDFKVRFNLNTAQLSRLLGIHHTTISRWERGKNNTSLAALAILALERLEQILEQSR